MKLSVFCARPAIYAPLANFCAEFLATALFVSGVLLFMHRGLIPAAHSSLLEHSQTNVAADLAAHALRSQQCTAGSFLAGATPLYIGALLGVVTCCLGGPTGAALDVSHLATALRSHLHQHSPHLRSVPRLCICSILLQ